MYHSSSSIPHKRKEDEDEEYLSSVITHKNDFWRSKCLSAVLKIKDRGEKDKKTKLQRFQLLGTFNRYDRWERTGFRKVNWRRFYDEIQEGEQEKENSIDPCVGILVGIGLVLFFILLHHVLDSI